MNKFIFALIVSLSSFVSVSANAECADKNSADWLKPVSEKISYQKPLARKIPGCCKVCTRGQACGDSCIPVWEVCHQYGGCACNG